ncbi:MAG TPA: hypothetical protein VIL28_17765 [Steroidobacteraceae bacterium]
MTKTSALDARQLAALLISGGVLVVTAIYWITQILGVIEQLKLAYG